jgi:hypothetical protein
LKAESRAVRVVQETSAFLATLSQRLFKIYPAMFEITGVIPEPILE